METTKVVNSNLDLNVVKNETSKKVKKEVKAKKESSTVKKESANVKANEHILNNMLSNLDKSMFVSNSGINKESVYKKDLFAHCITDTDKKRTRTKLRNVLDNFINSFITYDKRKDKNAIKKLSLQFADYYKNVYQKNDYTIESLVSNNTNMQKIKSIQIMLSIIKANK